VLIGAHRCSRTLPVMHDAHTCHSTGVRTV
jgi:hypothetical protein